MTEVDMEGTIFIVGVFVTATALSLFIDRLGDELHVIWWIRGVVWVMMIMVMLGIVLWIIGAFGR